MDELPPAATYSEYADLQDTPVEPEVLFEMLRSPDWRIQFEGLDLVRVLCKFQWELLFSISADALTKVVELTDSPRSTLSKKALTALAEIFLIPRREVAEIIGQVAPMLLLKSQSEKSFLKKEAHAALDLASRNCACDALVDVLTQHCSHKSGSLADTAFHYLEIALPRVPEAVAFYACASLVDSKRKPTIKGSVNYLRILQTSENFPSLLVTLDQTTQARVTRALDSRPAEQTDLRSMMRQAKAAHQTR
jgi:hypothetical protein